MILSVNIKKLLSWKQRKRNLIRFGSIAVVDTIERFYWKIENSDNPNILMYYFNHIDTKPYVVGLEITNWNAFDPVDCAERLLYEALSDGDIIPLIYKDEDFH